MEGTSSNGRANNSRFLNPPWVLHFQKMGLELKCPLCLNFFDEPVLLPCNHLFCKACMPFAAPLGSECPLCKAGFVDRDVRPAPFMDKMVAIYRSLDATFSASMSKLVSSDVGVAVEHSRFDQSVPYAASKCKEFEGCSMPVDCKGENRNTESRKGSRGRCGDCRMLPMNQTDQLSEGSPPPFGDSKASDDSSDECRGHGSKNDSDRRSVIITNAGDDKLQSLKCMSSASEEEGHLRDLKRQKILDYGQLQLGIRGADCTHSPVSEFGNSVTSKSEIEHKYPVAIVSNKPTEVDDAIVKNVKCAFCQSAKISEDTGPILHYMNGSLVVGTEAALPNVIHVHKVCVDWAPQAFYEGDSVQNLKAEVARGSKLKCSKCGLKGAALGCYLKSCQKSYHVPCALEIQQCRWDMDNYLVLCPSHSSVRFPDEKSKPRKMPSNQSSSFQMTQQDPSTWVFSSDGARKWKFCGSALSAEERNILLKFAKMTGATVSKFWKPDVTHVIASSDENGACTRTYKVLMGILNGIWILKMDWVKACMKERRPLNEEAYEIALDNYGCVDGPKSGRLRVLNNAPRLFIGLNFYFTGDFPLAYKEDLQDLVTAAGGTITENEENLAEQNCDEQAAPKALVVYNLDSPVGCKVGEEVSLLWQRLNEAEGIAAKVGAQVIGHTWLVESIAAGILQPFVSC